MMHRSSFCRIAIAAIVLVVSRSQPTAQGVPKLSEPVWITVSWFNAGPGGNQGNPSDRKDRSPAAWSGTLCRPPTLDVRNYSGQVVVVNKCTVDIDFAMCRSAGAEGQTDFPVCAVDPFKTDNEHFRWETLTPGPDGNFWQGARTMTLQIFYCSNHASLMSGDYMEKLGLENKLTCVE
jgi:hypothetical protein